MKNGQEKKPIYQRKWFIGLVVIVAIGIFANLGGGDKTDKTAKEDSSSLSAENSKTQESVEKSTSSAVEEAKDSVEELVDNVKDTASSVVETSDFEAKDTSDATIESIKTYNDYMEMFNKIINEYYASAEAVYTNAGLPVDTTSLRAQTDATVEAQKQQYGVLGNAPLVGKSGLVSYLKEYRDGLNSYVETLKQSLGQ